MPSLRSWNHSLTNRRGVSHDHGRRYSWLYRAEYMRLLGSATVASRVPNCSAHARAFPAFGPHACSHSAARRLCELTEDARARSVGWHRRVVAMSDRRLAPHRPASSPRPHGCLAPATGPAPPRAAHSRRFGRRGGCVLPSYDTRRFRTSFLLPQEL